MEPFRRSISPGWSSLALDADEKSTFKFSLFLYATILLPLLIADRYNVDDWGRSVIGYLNWGNNGRPLTDLIMKALALGKPLVDFSPICQIGAIMGLSWLSAVVARKFKIKNPLVASLVSFPLGGNPFFLANLSFKFDSLSMALSLIFALVPIVLDSTPDKKNPFSIYIGGVFLLGSLCLYQPGMNAFLVVAVLEYLLLQKENASSTVITALIRRRIFQLLVAILAYEIVALCTVREGYGAEHASLVHGIEGLAIVKHNLVDFWSFTFGLLTGRLRVALVFPIAMALLAAIGVGLRFSARTSEAAKLVWMISAFVAPILMLLGNFGFLIFLQSPIGGVRIFIGFGALLASSLILITSVMMEYNIPGRFQCCLLFIPAYSMIAFSAIFANATKAQKEYEKHIVEKLSDEINEIVELQPVKKLIIDGTVGYAPLVERMIDKRYRLLAHLVPIDLVSDEDGGFAHMVLAHQGISFPPEVAKAIRKSILAETRKANAERRSVYYELFLLDGDLVVRLSPNKGDKS
jgi:hypothetical protein